MLRGRILCPPLRARPILAARPALSSPRWQSATAPTAAEENSIPLGNDKGHISKAENESLAFFDRESHTWTNSRKTRS